MAKAFAGYQSESGKIHKTEHDAWLDDLSTVIAGSGLINEPTAAGFVKYLTSTNGAIAVFADIVANVAKTAPLPEPEAVEPREPEPPIASIDRQLSAGDVMADYIREGATPTLIKDC